jgi:hypothetical protein
MLRLLAVCYMTALVCGALVFSCWGAWLAAHDRAYQDRCVDDWVQQLDYEAHRLLGERRHERQFAPLGLATPLRRY